VDIANVRREQVDGENPVEGDLYVDAVGNFTTVEGADEEAQAITVRLRTFLGEWVLDITQGIPYRERILGVKGASDATIRRLLSAEILARGSVTNIVNLGITRVPALRTAEVTFEATLSDGGTVSRTLAI